MATPLTQQELTGQLLEWTKENKLQQVEACWIEQIGALPSQGAFYKNWLKAMRRADAFTQAEELLGLLLENRLENHKYRTALRLLAAILPIFPKSALLRPALLEALRGAYADLEMREALIRHIGLTGDGSLVEGFQAFQEWYKLTPGQVYQHYDWGEGVVQELDLSASKVTLAFPADPAKLMTVEGVRKHLAHIEAHHYLAQRTKDPESLRKLAESDPAALVKRVLASQTGRQVKQGELKALLTPSVIAAEQWNGWWSRTREALKLDPYLDFDPSGGAHTPIHLRELPRSFEQEIEERFFAEDAGTALKAELIRQLARRAHEAGLPLALAKRMGARLEEDRQLLAEAGPAARLEVAYMLEDLALAIPEAGLRPPDSAPILAAIGDYRILFEMDNVDYGIRAFARLIERDGEAGCQQAAALLPLAPVKLAQALWGALDEENHLDAAVAALQRLFDRPLANPDTYAWAVRATLDGSWSHLHDTYPPSAVVPDVLEAMENWQRLASDGGPAEAVGAAKSLLSRMRTLLAANKFEALARTVQAMSRDAANRLRHTIQVHPALPAAFRAQADRMITLTRRDLQEAPAKSAEDEAHYCTARAYSDKLAELRTITSTKIPKNSKVIEEARMEGDLRENAGYQYAKEEQKMLVQQQASLSDLLSRAQVVHAQEIDPATICFGTQFRVLNLKSHEEETYTILGRWEANPERHILSMQAPLAQQFMGHKVGDAVTIDHPGGGQTPYEILAIENALELGAWDKAPEGPA